MERISVEAPAENEASNKEETAPDSPDVNIPVEYYLPENVPSYYSDAITVLHSANEFVLSFCQTDYPLATSKEDLQQVKLIRRRCVARVILSPAQFQALTKVVQDQMDKFIQSYRKPDNAG